MTKNNPMTASERQRRGTKHVVTSTAKQYGRRSKPLTPTAPELAPSSEMGGDSASQREIVEENPETGLRDRTEVVEENPDMRDPTEVVEENPDMRDPMDLRGGDEAEGRSGGEAEGPSGGDNEGPSGAAPEEEDGGPEEDDGGPIDKSVLTSFKDHIAYAIWNREEDETRKLATICHWPKLREWDLSQEVEGVQSRVRASGLTPLIDHTYRYIDYVSIQAFVERWQPETNTFHLPFGEMTITLDDVRQILGVPVEGDCFTSDEGAKEIQPHVAIEMASKLLGVTEAEVNEQTKETYAIKLQWLKERCMGRATNESTPEELDICARGYIMFLLGCVVFPDKTKTKVSIYYLGCLRDMSKIGTIGWGMAILAHTYRQLGHASRSGVKSICGCLSLIVAWINEHFQGTVHTVPNMEYTELEPRICRWKAQQCTGDTATALITLREKLDDLSAIDVCWDPYKDHRSARPFHEVSYYCGLLICFDIAEPYYPERVLRQFGRVQTVPTMPVIQPLKLTRGKTIQAYKVVYNVNRWQQQNWSNHLLNPTLRSKPVTYPWEYDTNYMDWFLKITHPYIQVPSLRTTPIKIRGTEEIAHAKLQVVVDKAISQLYGVVGAEHVRDMLINARKDTRQDKGQEDRRKKRHDTTRPPTAPPAATPAASTRPPTAPPAATSATARRPPLTPPAAPTSTARRPPAASTRAAAKGKEPPKKKSKK